MQPEKDLEAAAQSTHSIASNVPKTEDSDPSPQNSESEAGPPLPELDWDPDDVDNPHNWPFWKKVFHTMIPALYGFAV